MPGEATYYMPDEAKAASRKKQAALNKRLEARRKEQGGDLYSGRQGTPQHRTTKVDTTTDAYKTTHDFLQKYHNNVVDSRRVGKQTDSIGRSSEITMMTTGIEHKGKEYVLPSYNPLTGKVENDPGKVLQRFLPLIESGVIKGFNSPEEGVDAARSIREAILSAEPERLKPWHRQDRGSAGPQMRYK